MKKWIGRLTAAVVLSATGVCMSWRGVWRA